MKILGIIPARYSSSRFPGKPLVKIQGQTMIERVYGRVAASGKFGRIVVATDDRRIFDEVNRFSGEAVMTSSSHRSGTDRIWEIVCNGDYHGAINIQGDEPLVDPHLISELYDLLDSGKFPVVSAAFKNHDYSDFISAHNVKVVLDKNCRAMYFSRSPIPHAAKDSFNGFLHHIGIYGYLYSALETFSSAEPGILEKKEKLEQLRFLENGIGLRILKTSSPAQGVDVPSDVKKIESLLKKDKS